MQRREGALKCAAALGAGWQESTVSETEQLFARAHFFLACSSDSCTLRMRTRFHFNCDCKAVDRSGASEFRLGGRE
jgi:hypothetical protein